MDITERNQRDSPLLQLPGELRNNIWKFASAVKCIVRVTLSQILDGGQDGLVCEILQSAANPKAPAVRTSIGPVSDFLSIRKVCRQVSAETDPLAPFKVFLFAFDNVWTFFKFAEQLSPAQCSAIHTIAMGTIPDRGNYLSQDELTGLREKYGVPTGSISFRNVLPNLQRIYLKPAERPDPVICWNCGQRHWWQPGLDQWLEASRMFYAAEDRDVGLEIIYLDVVGEGEEAVNKRKVETCVSPKF